MTCFKKATTSMRWIKQEISQRELRGKLIQQSHRVKSKSDSCGHWFNDIGRKKCHTACSLFILHGKYMTQMTQFTTPKYEERKCYVCMSVYIHCINLLFIVSYYYYYYHCCYYHYYYYYCCCYNCLVNQFSCDAMITRNLRESIA